ncbi:hypothetical protein BDQ12DRAFT_665494 [Crucibulum laeve]|uniref:Uncharacterized protein n=1 Tax=Crucibulum laeve TaxID=68775 RepID=A0A5C3M441_9AGAR|nr:hypothetical protein BDQ12DRAFT_665494 [Crucibulum laeve]
MAIDADEKDVHFQPELLDYCWEVVVLHRNGGQWAIVGEQEASGHKRVIWSGREVVRYVLIGVDVIFRLLRAERSGRLGWHIAEQRIVAVGEGDVQPRQLTFSFTIYGRLDEDSLGYCTAAERASTAPSEATPWNEVDSVVCTLLFIGSLPA